MIISSLLFITSVGIYFLIYINRKKISKKLSVEDLPDENRKIHKLPTPKTASYSMAALFLIFLISNYFFHFYNLVDINFTLKTENKISIKSQNSDFNLLCLPSTNFPTFDDNFNSEKVLCNSVRQCECPLGQILHG